ncbi:hypothetical protein DUNSADRAFT_13934 [Dunaliella salina]|uniref:Uncharacterized protein n=1 Tax=Dunaliella salina TaxID=3046 RepID=A0ABQ7G8E3_DUNSA|nr:hypothetical protein DUNSADRAFT_13934 [Dunaliella salina]|eukprot:KAF5830874.1 hypothetical protein DUNSADRAFT_13934 [Dunaliella salina]
MGNCLASPVGSNGESGDVAGPVLTAAAGEGLSNTELVAQLTSGTFEQRLAALQHLAKATSKTDEDCAAARFRLIEEDVLGPLTQLLRGPQRPALRAAAAQAFCNLSYACALSNLSRAPELVQPLLLAMGRLNSIANHIVMSSACDVTVKASFAQLLLNASLHSVLEVQQLDWAGGLAAALKLLDDPKGNAVGVCMDVI